jgi:RNA polymerase sigma-70 factor (ECF subfamily)
MSPLEPPIPFPGAESRPVHPADAATDARLLAEMAAGQSGSLAELYRRRGGPLLALLLRMLGDPREAEEALQDTFVQLWRRARHYDAAKAGPFTWMVMIARGLALDRLRSRARQTAAFDGYREAAGAVVADSHDGYASTAGSETTGEIVRALGKLPPEQRQAIELAFWRGCTQEEIARTTGEPLGTIKARIRRGMLALRHQLKDRHE